MYNSNRHQTVETCVMLNILKKDGIYLPDPEITFGHLWGTPTETGNQNNFGISQSFDFPTVYGHRNKIANLENENLDRVYRSQRVNILQRAKQIARELAYYNALAQDYTKRVEIARLIAASYQKKFDQGEIDAIERNKVYMNLTSCLNEREKIDIERSALLTELKALNGGKEIQTEVTEIPLTPLPSDFDTWYAETAKRNPALQYLSTQIDISRRQVKLNAALGLPKFTAGYSSERILGEKLQGLFEKTAGLHEAALKYRTHLHLTAMNRF